jgi:hypothetical protein
VKVLGAGLLVAIVSSGATALADGDNPGLQVGLRTGWTLPTGRLGNPSGADEAYAINDFLPVGVPMWIDAGYRASSRLYIGVYFEDVLFLGCGANEQGALHPVCSNIDVQIGLALELHYGSAGRALDPWFGFLAGYESARTSQGTGSPFALAIQGVNAGVQTGVDWKVAQRLTLGPFGSFTLGRYYNGTSTDPAWTDFTYGFPHIWLALGIRGTVDAHL